MFHSGRVTLRNRRFIRPYKQITAAHPLPAPLIPSDGEDENDLTHSQPDTPEPAVPPETTPLPPPETVPKRLPRALRNLLPYNSPGLKKIVVMGVRGDDELLYLHFSNVVFVLLWLD